jgi:O-acetyl-ADP-ribose deacetylase (regulator of RNase III)
MESSPLYFRLRDINLAVVAAWSRCFADCRDVEISQGDIFAQPADAIVSPANSFGFMDGGIDLAYSMRFGWTLETRLQAHLRAEHDGELPVGQAVIVETGDPLFRHLVSAPTMRVPMDVSGTVNAFLAFRAVIRIVRAYNQSAAQPIRSVLCPGLGTAIGRMHPDACARQMYHAYRTSHLGEPFMPVDLMAAARNHFELGVGARGHGSQT